MSGEPKDRLRMTDEQWEQFQAHTRGYGEQHENEVDLSQLRGNLLLTPTECVERVIAGQRLVEERHRAGAADADSGRPTQVEE